MTVAYATTFLSSCRPHFGWYGWRYTIMTIDHRTPERSVACNACEDRELRGPRSSRHLRIDISRNQSGQHLQ